METNEMLELLLAVEIRKACGVLRANAYTRVFNAAPDQASEPNGDDFVAAHPLSEYLSEVMDGRDGVRPMLEAIKALARES